MGARLCHPTLDAVHDHDQLAEMLDNAIAKHLFTDARLAYNHLTEWILDLVDSKPDLSKIIDRTFAPSREMDRRPGLLAHILNIISMNHE